MKKIKTIIASTLILSLFGCVELQQVVNQLPTTTSNKGMGNVTKQQISLGLKEALKLGVLDGIGNLSKKDGFFKNQATKILLPQELQAVDKTLRSVGLGNLADNGLKLLNRAAEDAVVEAKPIFTNAITSINFNDAKNILLGTENAATNYLNNKTNAQLISTFKPKIKNSLNKVGANKIWSDLIKQYNNITGKNINSDLTSYVTQQAVNGVFTMIAQKEKGIRNNIGLRSTNLLKEVFALQDK